MTYFATPRRNRSGLRCEAGIIVLGPLIFITILLLVLVVGGKILYSPPPASYVDRRAPELLYAHSPLLVYSGERAVLRIEPGDSAWTVVLDNGTAVVFGDSLGREPLGIATGGLLWPWR